MKNIILLIIFFVFKVSSIKAMDWPMDDNTVLVNNFGFNNKGRPILGSVFEGEGKIKAVDKGEIIYSSTGKESRSRLPSPLGSWNAVDHGNGLISIYSRYEENSLTQKTSIEKGTEIASSGMSGWSGNNGLYFILYDQKEQTWINPSLIITPFSDTVPPQITGIQLYDANGKLVENPQFGKLKQGKYNIKVNVFDILTDEKRKPLAPYRIISSVNGEETAMLTFDTMSTREGELMVNRNGLIPARRIYAAQSGFLASEVQLNRGLVMLEIIVMDISGNASSILARMTVE